MFVKPGQNTYEVELLGPLLRVRIPHTHQMLPDEGQEVPDNDPHWIRLLRDGDVVLAERPAAAAEHEGAQQ